MKELDKIKEIFDKKRIDNKDECYLLYNKGLFGNRALVWNSYDEILKSGWKGNICVRGRKTQIKREQAVYNIGLGEVPETIEKFKKQGISESHLGFNESMPDEHLTIQGEVMRTQLGFSVWYSTIKTQMNPSLKKESLYVNGLKAHMLLKLYMSASSYEDLMVLLDLFPDSAIEFSCYNISVGNISGRNTVIWEVRNY